MTADLDLASLSKAPNRFALWAQVIADREAHTIAEIGVYRGVFTEAMLVGCPGITTYYLIDPWRHLDDWNKPLNNDDAAFQEAYDEVMTRTAPWESKRVILRGRTTEVVDSIPDGSLDVAYIDGDHTLRGISIDLIRMWQKLRSGGVLGGDDFTQTIWQHGRRFEPTLVFPFAVFFAEAVGAPIVALPHSQYLIRKLDTGFSFRDPTGQYGDRTLNAVLRDVGTTSRLAGRLKPTLRREK